MISKVASSILLSTGLVVLALVLVRFSTSTAPEGAADAPASTASVAGASHERQSPAPAVSRPVIERNGPVAGSELDKLAFLAATEHEHSPATHSVAVDYWRPTNAVGFEIMRSELAASDAIREALLAKYGNDAVDDPLFAKYFFPLGPGFEFLSSSKQIAIARLRTESRLSMAGAEGESISVSRLQESQRQYMEAIRALLTEAEYFEFQLRESSLARRLRSIGIDWSEREFRSVYAIRSQAHDAASIDGAGALASFANTAGSSGLYDPEIDALLGRDRYIEYLKAQDPAYRRMQAAAASSGRSSSEVDDAYRRYVEMSHGIVAAERAGDLASARDLTQERDETMAAQWGAGAPVDFRSRIPKQLLDSLTTR